VPAAGSGLEPGRESELPIRVVWLQVYDWNGSTFVPQIDLSGVVAGDNLEAVAVPAPNYFGLSCRLCG
jgi:hypothetical protein